MEKDVGDFSLAPAWRALQFEGKDSLAVLHHPSLGLQGLQFEELLWPCGV